MGMFASMYIFQEKVDYVIGSIKNIDILVLNKENFSKHID